MKSEEDKDLMANFLAQIELCSVTNETIRPLMPCWVMWVLVAFPFYFYF